MNRMTNAEAADNDESAINGHISEIMRPFRWRNRVSKSRRKYLDRKRARERDIADAKAEAKRLG